MEYPPGSCLPLACSALSGAYTKLCISTLWLAAISHTETHTIYAMQELVYISPRRPLRSVLHILRTIDRSCRLPQLICRYFHFHSHFIFVLVQLYSTISQQLPALSSQIGKCTMQRFIFCWQTEQSWQGNRWIRAFCQRGSVGIWLAVCLADYVQKQAMNGSGLWPEEMVANQNECLAI